MVPSRRCSSLLGVLVLGAIVSSCAAGDRPTAIAAPPDLSAVAGEILDLWSGADLVCLGETHGSVFDAALRTSLVAHPRFSSTVDVVVVEFASPLHQTLLDRLVLGGESLSRDELRPVWRDAGLGEIWELAQYEEFFRAVAQRNQDLPRSQRVRIVAAALPIEWNRVQTSTDLTQWGDRAEQFEAVLRREVLDTGKKGLAVFGRGHCERRSPSMFSRLAAHEPERVRAVFGFEGARGVAAARERLELGAKPHLLPVTGTPLAVEPAGAMFFEGHAQVPLGNLLDAVVSYGSNQDTVLDPADLSFTPELRRELDRRARLWLAAQRRE